MEINRNQYFMVGIIILLLGLQLRAVNSYVLNEEATQLLAKTTARQPSTTETLVASIAPGQMNRKVIRPPEWCGWCIASIGAILILHSLALKKSGG